MGNILIIISKKKIIILITIPGEDWKTAACLLPLGARVVDTRDARGRHTFLTHSPGVFLSGKHPEWLRWYDVHQTENVSDKLYNKHDW